MEKLGKKFIFRIFAEYCEIFYKKRMGIIYTHEEEIINKKELEFDLKEFIKIILTSNYKEPISLVPAVNAAVEGSKNKKIASDFGAWILYNQGIDYGAPIPEDD